MSWKSTYVILRLSNEGSLTEVFQSDDLKKTKYWLSYIGEVGDLMCRTPNHPKHSRKNSEPEYFSHKEEAGKAGMDESKWRDAMVKRGWNLKLPSESVSATSSEVGAVK